MQLFLKKLGIFTLLTALVFQAFGFLLEKQFARDYSNKFTWVKKHRSQHFDYAFLGTSRVLNMVDINEIDSVAGTEGINLGIGGINYRGMYMLLYAFLEKQNNHINTLYLQIDPFSLYKDSLYSKPRYDHNFYDLAEDPVIKECLDGNLQVMVYKYFPVVKYIEYNKVFNLHHFIRSFTGDEQLDQTKGSILIANHKTFRPGGAQGDAANTQLSAADTLYLNKILRLAQTHGIQPVLYTAPVYQYRQFFHDKYPDYTKFVTTLTQQYRIKHYDFSESFQNQKDYYSDMIHLNTRGTIAFTNKILESISTFPL